MRRSNDPNDRYWCLCHFTRELHKLEIVTWEWYVSLDEWKLYLSYTNDNDPVLTRMKQLLKVGAAE